VVGDTPGRRPPVSVPLHVLPQLHRNFLPQDVHVRPAAAEGCDLVEVGQRGVVPATLTCQTRAGHQRLDKLVEQLLPARVGAMLRLGRRGVRVVDPPVPEGLLGRVQSDKKPAGKHSRSSYCVACELRRDSTTLGRRAGDPNLDGSDATPAGRVFAGRGVIFDNKAGGGVLVRERYRNGTFRADSARLQKNSRSVPS